MSELSDTGITRARASDPWSYRFNVAGKTYKGLTDTHDRAQAKKVSKAEKAKVVLLIKEEQKVGRGPMSFGRACELFIAEKVPTFRSMQEHDARTQIDFMQKYVKAGLELHNIQARDIQAMMQARAGCLKKARGGVLVRIKASTVNQTLELFKRILGHAHDAHGATLRHYKWSAFLQKTQKLRRGDKAKRAIAPTTEAALLAAIHPNYLQVTRFALLTGMRANENLLRWDQVDWDNQAATDVRGKGRREVGRTVRLGRAAMAILQAEYNRPDRDPDFVFTYLCTKTRIVGRTGGKMTIRGQRYPLTYSGWNTAWDRTKEKLGLQGQVRLHDWRHTFATRMAKLVNPADLQSMMDHSKMETTMGYVTIDDTAIRAALDSVALPMQEGFENVAPLVAPKTSRKA